MPAAEPTHDQACVQATMCATFVDQWVRDGVTHAMVAPGSRSTPMALAIVSRAELHVEIFHDERAAAFAALGAGLAGRRPAIVLCTSGTAATHFHGAVVEAHLSGVPMLVLTADRPPELRDVGAPQTIDQTKLYGDAVRWYHDPGVPAQVAAGTWRALARHAHEAATGPRPGPVHLNLPFREPLVGEPFELDAPSLGPLSAVPAPALRLGTLAMQIDCERGLIVAGRGVDDPAAVASLSAATGWPILADPRSGCRGLPTAVAAFDALLRHDDFALSHRPDVVLHLGEPPASKVLAQWLADVGGIQVRVSSTGVVIDPTCSITHRVTASIGELCTRLATELHGGHGSMWIDRWIGVSAQADAALARALTGDAPFDEPAVARIVSGFDGHAVVASSMPIRDVEWFGSPVPGATVWSNRGANGIDGTLATAVGVAAVTGRPTVVLVGDVALLHDSSSLIALAARQLDVRIVVIDNDGGGIFSFLPQATSLPADRFEHLFGTPHGTDLVALAAAHGLRGATVASADELHSWLGRPGPWLVVARSDRAANVTRHRQLNEAVVAAIAP